MIEIPTVDLFAGVGGSSKGAEDAGYRVVWAGNHWREACDCYDLNHRVKAKCQDLHQAIWETLPFFRVLIASPSCTGHTKAKGKEKPGHDQARSTAWAVVSCAEEHLPYLIVVENVREFLSWNLYPAWKLALEALGYTLSVHVVDAADHGVPQNRVRVFIICTRSRKPLILKLPQREHVPAVSILGHKRNWTPIRSLCDRTRASITRGRVRFGKRFFKVYYSGGNGLVGRSIYRPLGTLTTNDRFALVEGNRLGMLTVDECRAGMGFPVDYRLPENQSLAKHLLGNAVCPQVMADILTACRRSA